MIKVKNWSKYQSYKDRRPPWIRFHRSIIDDYQFQLMSAESRALLPMLWLLACEDEDPTSGLIRHDSAVIAFRLRQDVKIINKCIEELQAIGFIERIESVTKPLRDRNQTVSPETETETETETEVCRFSEFWDVFADKRGKDGAQRVWNRKGLDRIADEVISGAKRYAANRGVEKRYWKQAQGWLNDGRWADEVGESNIVDFQEFGL